GGRGVPRAGRPPRSPALPRGVLLGAWGLVVVGVAVAAVLVLRPGAHPGAVAATAAGAVSAGPVPAPVPAPVTVAPATAAAVTAVPITTASSVPAPAASAAPPPPESSVATVTLERAAPRLRAQPLVTPELLCAGRNAFQHFVCMERECLRPVFRQHPECRRWEQVGRRGESP
ncbi:MAG: hypothetical protein KGI90_14165, partial [Burkholderiales bacterium]|nr:hypothetical protein [Burkholderiales bacterium]